MKRSGEAVNSRFWADVWTVLRKEWLEWTAAPGSFIQPIVIVVVFGVLFPLTAGPLWTEQPIVQWLWSWLPLVLSAGLMADTFAGERERDTLEALLASRLPDRAILLGKAAAVAAYGWAVTLSCWLAGAAVVWLSAGGQSGAVPAQMALWLPILSFLAAWYVACTGVLISLRAQSVHQAQQWMSVAMLGTLLVAGLFAAPLLPAGTGDKAGQALVLAAAVLAVLDLGLLLALLARPQRGEWLIY